MNARADEPETALTYDLSCVDCSFETTVEGDAFDVLDAAQVHEKNHESDAVDHFVEFEATDAE